MSGTGASKLPEKTEPTKVTVVGHEADGQVENVNALGAEFGNGRTMEGVGGLNVNVTGIKRGSAKNVTAVGLKFN